MCASYSLQGIELEQTVAYLLKKKKLFFFYIVNG